MGYIKPQCGSVRNSKLEYDFALQIAGLFLVFAVSCIGAGFPVVAQRINWLKVPSKVFFACKHFGTGVLIATAFIHLLPTAFNSLSDPCLPDLFTKTYTPLAGLIMMGSMFFLFLMEMYLNSKASGHSHGGATSEFSTSRAKAVRHSGSRHVPRHANRSIIGCVSHESNEEDDSMRLSNYGTPANPRVGGIDIEAGGIDGQIYQKVAANITILEVGILFHSVFVGITVAVTTDGFVALLIAILFHQLFEGLGLGSRIATVPWKQQWRPWVLVGAFAVTAPIGQGIGLATRTTWDPSSTLGLILVGVFNAISSGLLIYATLVDLLVEDFLRGDMDTEQKMWAFAFVILGAIGMSVVVAFA